MPTPTNDREALWWIVDKLGCGPPDDSRFVVASDPHQDNDREVLTMLKSYLVGGPPAVQPDESPGDLSVTD